MLIRDIIPPKKKKLFPKIITLLLVIIIIIPFFIGIKGSAAQFIETQQTYLDNYSKWNLQLQVVGTKIYYVWSQFEVGSWFTQIWTGEMNINGTGWSATQRKINSNSQAWSYAYPQLQVVDTKIYYVWQEWDGTYTQIWTAEMNTDGSGWVATKRTTTAFTKQYPQLQVVGSKIYYVWNEWDGSYTQIWTAEMNTDGSGWSATQRTNSAFMKYSPQLQVVNDKIYYVWSECDGASIYCTSQYWQIWTAEMNTDGSGWVATQRTTSTFNKTSPQFQVVATKIYYVWTEFDGSYYQIWTAEMNTDGSGWAATKITTDAFTKNFVQSRMVGEKIYFVWVTNNEIWTAKLDIGNNMWSAEQEITTGYSKYYPQLQVTGSKIYYVWDGQVDAGGDTEIWTAEMGLDLIGITEFLTPPPEEIPSAPPEQPPILGKTIEEMKKEDILKQMIDVLTQLTQLYNQLIQILRR